MKPGIHAIIFDVDGTLAETEEAHRLAFNQAFAEARLTWHWSAEAYRHLLKVTGGKERICHYIQEVATPHGNVELTDLIGELHARKTEIYTKMIAKGAVSLRPGIENLIRQARDRGLKLGIATTTSQPNVEALLKSTLGSKAIDWFGAVCCGDSVARKKPAPDIYTSALKQLSIPSSSAIAIEDSWNGIRSARKAGIRVLATPSQYSSDDNFSEASLVFANADEIVQWLFED